MAKQSGLGMNVWIAGYDLSGDYQGFGRIACPLGVLDVTAVNQDAMDRIGGLHDGGIDAVTYFDPATAASHEVLSALPTTDVHVTVTVGSALGSPAASLVSKQIGYDPTRANDGGLTFAVSSVANGYGLDWGVLLTAGKRTDTAATNGTSVDLTDVSTAFGWQAYLQVLSITGTSVTVALEDSASAGSGFAALSGGAFTAVASPGPGTQRLAGAATATVRRYVRAVTTGTFTEAIFAVNFTRNLTARD